ncbi:L,D-transpeptidase family protein [Paenibacillus abyssi]|uniref:L,D-TPase catalytic domain-containing protein n=1 Tax=Paenibacillus abyssi TaxID=1340531 RepID=A0A917CX72_9BACL|nr:L,D-transpeptidase family protein [Paenibacillus abyssi]GGG00820.1 hypothetical protein GCM10010916_17420 [Paenibacillus abyssi]
MKYMAALKWILVYFVVTCLCLTVMLPAGTVKADGKTVSSSFAQKLDHSGSSQVILVKADHTKSFTGRLSLLEKENGNWIASIDNVPVVLGKNGINKQKEGDGKTPTGIFPLGTAFGSTAAPAGIKLAYKRTTKYHYWIDDPSSKDYNKWIHYTKDPLQKWKSFERLYQPLYKYAIVIGYNERPIKKGKGSAIFIHLWRSPEKPTAGCVAMSEQNLLTLLKALDKSKSPRIAIVAGSS